MADAFTIHIDRLANEQMVQIFSYLDMDDLLLSARPVCRRWKELTEDEYIWRKVRYQLARSLAGTTEVDRFLNMLRIAAPHVEELVFHYHTAKKTREQPARDTFDRLMEEVILHQGIECVNLRSIKFYDIPQLETLVALLEKYPNLQTISCGRNIDIDLSQLLEIFVNRVPNLKNLNCSWHMVFAAIEHHGGQAYENEANRVIQDIIRGHPELEVFTPGISMKTTTLDLLLAECPNLRSIKIEEYLPSLAQNPGPYVGTSLQEIYLKGFTIRNEHVQMLCSNVKQIKSFKLKRCDNLTNEAFNALNQCRKLETLILLRCTALTDQVYVKHISKCISLKKIVLNKARDPFVVDEPPDPRDELYTRTPISDVGLCALATGCPDLRELHLAGCSLITDGGVMAVADHCPRLECLDVTGCEEITDFSILALAERSRELHTLAVNECLHITQVGLNSLIITCSKLKNLGVKGSEFARNIDLSQFTSLPHVFDSYVPHSDSAGSDQVAEIVSDPWAETTADTCTCNFQGLARIRTRRCPKLAVIDNPANFRQIYAQQSAQQGVGAIVGNGLNANQNAQNVNQQIQNGLNANQNAQNVNQNQNGLNPNQNANNVNQNQNGPNANQNAQNGEQQDINQILVTPARARFLSCLSDPSVPSTRRYSPITQLSLYACAALDDRSVEQISIHCPELRVLDIGACPSLTDAAFRCLARNSHFLRWLRIGWCTKDTVYNLIHSLAFLEDFDFCINSDPDVTQVDQDAAFKREIEGIVTRQGKVVHRSTTLAFVPPLGQLFIQLRPYRGQNVDLNEPRLE